MNLSRPVEKSRFQKDDSWSPCHPNLVEGSVPTVFLVPKLYLGTRESTDSEVAFVIIPLQNSYMRGDINKTKYWIVGAAWGGVDHQDKAFLSKGIWMLGWEQGNQHDKASQIKAGDRIAIKRLLGRGKSGIRIMHIGVVKGVILDANKIICTVDWVASDVSRVMKESKGCFGAIHGPYTKSDPTTKQWIEEIFSL